MTAKRTAARKSKKVIEPEIIPEEEFIEDDESIDEVDEPIAEQEHIVKTRYTTRAPLSEINTAEKESYDDSDGLPKRKPSPLFAEREDIKKKLQQHGVGTGDQLKLRIEKLPSFKADGLNGTHATDKQFIDTVTCTVDYVLDGKHVLFARKFGAGDYWYTLRHGSIILRAWREDVIAPESSPVIQTDPATGATTIINQMPQQNGTIHGEPVKIPTRREMLKEMVEEIELTERLKGKKDESTQQSAGTLEERVGRILESQAVTEAIVKKVLGDSSGGGKAPSTTQLMFEHGPTILEALGKFVVNPIVGAIQQTREGRDVSQTQTRRQAPQSATPQPRSIRGGSHQVQHQRGPENVGDGTEAMEMDHPQTQGNEQTAPLNQTPEIQVMTYLIDAYLSKVPMRALIGNLRGMAEENPSLPDMLGGFAETEPGELMAWVAMLRPDVAAQVKTPEAEHWIRNLQQEIEKEWPASEEES